MSAPNGGVSGSKPKQAGVETRKSRRKSTYDPGRQEEPYDGGCLFSPSWLMAEYEVKCQSYAIVE